MCDDGGLCLLQHIVVVAIRQILIRCDLAQWTRESESSGLANSFDSQKK